MPKNNEAAPAPSEATATTTTTRSFTKKTREELVKEFGRVRMQRITEACFPSDEAIASITKLEAEVEELRKEIAEVPAAYAKLAQKALDGAEFKLQAAKGNLGNPAHVSEFDRKLVNSAAARLIKAGMANFVTVAQFVHANVDAFPIAGTKY
jgi:hypothetical protein